MRLHRQITSLLLAVCLCGLIAGCGPSGCGRTESTTTGPQYGVADMEQLMHAHPAFSDYFRLEQEYRNLQAQYAAERQQLIARSAQAQKQLQTALASGEIEKGLNTEYRAKMKLREDEWNQKLQEKYRELAAAEKQTPDELRQGIDLEIVNLQLKLRALQLRQDEREQMEKRLAELLAQRDGSLATGATLSPSAQAELQALREQAEKDLQAYADAVVKELSQKRADAQAHLAHEAALRIQPEGGDDWNRQWQEKLTAKQKELKDLENKMTEDIRQEAAQVASDKHLEMIFSRYRTNIKATDVTTDILARLTHIGGGTGK